MLIKLTNLFLLVLGILILFGLGFYMGYTIASGKGTYTIVTGVRSNQTLITKQVKE